MSFNQKSFNKTIGFFTLLSLAFFTSCSENSVSQEQEEHLDPVAIALVDEESGEQIAILYDEESLPDSVSKNILSIEVGADADLEIELLCLHENQLEHCDDEEHDHDHDHEESEESEEDHEDEEYSLVISIADGNIATASVHSGEFAFSLSGIKSGSTDLEVEIWHGSHADISGKVFELVVE